MYKFRPILKTIVWGGEKIAPFKGIQTSQEHIGESWELSGVKGNESVIDGGQYDGKTITELAETLKGALLGEKVYAATGTQFPLLIKFIDAKSDLSIQVHPDDALAAVRHNGSKGKTEMWYVVGADEGAHLLSGLSKAITPEEYVARVEDATITDVLTDYTVAPGDVFFLPAGRIHAIGAGSFIAEIQQTSDITYRIYDYGRRDVNGNLRELHTDMAIDAIKYGYGADSLIKCSPAPNTTASAISCPYFTTNIFRLSEPVEKDFPDIDSFIIYICVEGACSLEYDEGDPVIISKGESVLVPACISSLCFVPEGDAKLLEVYIKGE